MCWFINVCNLCYLFLYQIVSCVWLNFEHYFVQIILARLDVGFRLLKMKFSLFFFCIRQHNCGCHFSMHKVHKAFCVKSNLLVPRRALKKMESKHTTWGISTKSCVQPKQVWTLQQHSLGNPLWNSRAFHKGEGDCHSKGRCSPIIVLWIADADFSSYSAYNLWLQTLLICCTKCNKLKKCLINIVLIWSNIKLYGDKYCLNSYE